MVSKIASINFIHMCDYASVDKTGKLNIIGLFEGIYSPSFPYVHPQFFTVLNLSILKSGTYNFSVHVVDKKSNVLARFTLEKFVVKLPSGIRTIPIGLVAQFNNARFESPSEYAIEVMVDGIKLTSSIFNVFDVKK